jgi:ankyrin repeat protein
LKFHVCSLTKKGALHLAAEYGDYTIVQALLGAGADPNTRTSAGQTLLHKAAIGGSLKVMLRFLAYGMDINSRDEDMDTPLHFVLGRDDSDPSSAMLERLIQAGCEVNARNEDGQTPLHLYLGNASVESDVLEILLSNGADINIRDNNGDPVINRLAASVSEECFKLLLTHGLDVEMRSEDGKTLLHHVAELGLAAQVRMLLEKGVNPVVENEQKRQPIQYAAYTNEETVQALLDYAAEVDITSSEWPSPVVLAATYGKHQVLKLLLDHGADPDIENPQDPGWTALHAACYCKPPNHASVELLIAHGANINAIPLCKRTTALHGAVSSAQIVRLLLDKGALIDTQDYEGKTALTRACEEATNLEAVKILIEAGADPMVPDTRLGATALHYSCCSSDFTDIVMSSKSTLDVDVVDKDGYTPLMWAVKNGQTRAAAQLLEADCNVDVQDYNDKANVCILAARQGHAEVIRTLIGHSSGMMVTPDKWNRTALHEACYYGHLDTVKLLLEADVTVLNNVDFEDCTPLLQAAFGGHTQIVAFLLEQDGVNAFQRDKRGYTALLGAALIGNKEVVDLLMKVDGNDFELETIEGLKLLTCAAWGGLEDICQMLIANGKADCTSQTRYGGFYPLHLAALSDDTATIKLLLAHEGVEKNCRNWQGRTPLWTATLSGKENAVQVLVAHDVDVNAADEQERSALLMTMELGYPDICKMLLNAGAKMGLDETLELALVWRDEEIAQLLRDAGAIEQEDPFGLIGLMEEATPASDLIREEELTTLGAVNSENQGT